MSLINDIREVMEKQEYEKQSINFIYRNQDGKTFNIPAGTYDETGACVELKPKQYQIGIDTFARMEANCTLEEIMGFIKGNIDKYNFRKKNQDIQDFEKIISYSNWAIKQLKKEEEINRLSNI